eukprot:SAG11_NODE_856_length_6864_cov_12.741168_1_plen_472_part_00
MFFNTSSKYFLKIPALEVTKVVAEAGFLRFKLTPSNAIVPVTMPHATLAGPRGLVSTDEATRNAQLLDQNREILENMKAQQIQVENLVAEMNMLRQQPDAREVAQRAIDATLHEVNQGRRLLSAVRLTKDQESEIRSQELDLENLVLLSAEPDATTGERFNCFDASAPQESLRHIMFERYATVTDATLKQMASRMPSPPDTVWSEPGSISEEEKVFASQMADKVGAKLLKQDEGLAKVQASNLVIAKPILRTLNLACSNWSAAEQVRGLLGEFKSVTSGSVDVDNAANAKLAERIDLLMQQIIEREQDAIEVGSDCFTKVAMRIGAAQKKRKDIVFQIECGSEKVSLQDQSKKKASNWTISSQKDESLGGLTIAEHAAETQKRLIGVQKVRGPPKKWGKRQDQTWKKRKLEETSDDTTTRSAKKGKGKGDGKGKKGKNGKKGKTNTKGRQPKNEEGTPATQTKEQATVEDQ